MAHTLVFSLLNRDDCLQLRILEGRKLWEYLRPIVERARSEPDEGLAAIELDLVSHAVIFGLGQGLGDEQLSAFVSILWQTHRQSMDRRLGLGESSDLFQSLMIAHSVHRPPHSAQVFTLAEAQELHAYVLETYLRAHKLYTCAFTPPAVINLVSDPHSFAPPAPPVFPPLSNAKPLEVVRAAEEERAAREREEAAAQAAAEESTAVDQGPPGPSPVEMLPHPQGLKSQLAVIATEVGQLSGAQMEQLESQLDEIEHKLTELKDAKKGGKKK
eukprot:Hpha_TRINITY_DN9819_c0_g1::TRINITY_DN9819_c0_g1_i1::g.81418::m.81418